MRLNSYFRSTNKHRPRILIIICLYVLVLMQAFRKDHPLLSLINEALLNVSESPKLKELEVDFITSEKCVDVEFGYDEIASLQLNSFWVLFASTGGTSTIALLIYAIICCCKPHNNESRQSSSRVSHAESPKNSQNISVHWTNV